MKSSTHSDDRAFRKPLYKPDPNQEDIITKVDDLLYDANEVSQPDS
jgi:hypothetical protein